MESTATCPEVSVVIAAWNSWRFLPDSLSSVLNEDSVPMEIVVVDNGSQDGTPENLRKAYPSVRVVTNSKNEGHSRAINRGIQAAGGTYVLILDADTVFRGGVIRQLVDFMRSHPDAAIAAPKMLNGDGTVQETARRFPKPMNALFGRQTLLASLFPNNQFTRDYVRRESADATDPFEVDWVSSACMIFPRTLVQRVGYWDEGFYGYWVEADWCKQAHAAGKIYCVPQARVTHFYQNRAGRKKGVSRIIDFHYGAHRFYSKNYTRGRLDPRSILAAFLLSLRAVPLLLVDSFRRPEEVKTQPRETQPPRVRDERVKRYEEVAEAKGND